MRYRKLLGSSGLTLVVAILFQIVSVNSASGRSHIIFDGSSIATRSTFHDGSQSLGEGPGAVCIDYITEDTIVCPIFKSCGCSEYAVLQTPDTFRIDIYSILSIIWGTDCCLEDLPSFDRGKVDMVFTIINDFNSIYGYVQIINDNVDNYILSQLPEIETVISDPSSANISGEPFYRRLLYYINAYKSQGVSNAKLCDLIVAFEKEVNLRNLLEERDFEFRQIEFKQICELYKFALKYEKQRLGIDELKILGQICDEIRAYYSKELSIR